MSSVELTQRPAAPAPARHRRGQAAIGTMVTRLARPGVVAGVAIVLACVFVFHETRKLYFFNDDFEFLLSRNLSWHDLMTPHNEHWSTLPVLAFRIMVAIFGVGHYPAYALMPILVHGANCALLYLVMRRNGIGGWPAVVVTVPFAFLCGNLGENPLWDFQIGFLGSAFFGLLALLALTRDDRTGTYLAWAAMLGSLLCSGMAIPLLVWVGLYALLRHGLVRALVVSVPPALVYVVWFLAYGRSGASADNAGTADQYVAFVTTGLSTLYDRIDRFPGTGGVVLAALLAVAWLHRTRGTTRIIALSGVLSTLATYLFIGITRSGFGAGGGTAPRYAYFGVLFSLPAAALVCAALARRLTGRRVEVVVAGVLVVAALTANGVVQARGFADHRVTVLGTVRQTLPATQQLITENARLLTDKPLPKYDPYITVAAVRRAAAAGSLPHRRATTQGLLDVGVYLQAAAAPTSFGLPAATGLERARVTGTLAPSGCSTLEAVGTNAHLDLPPTAAGSQISMQATQSSYAARLVDGPRTSIVNRLPAVPGQRVYLASTSTRGSLRVMVPAGPLTVCLPS